MQNQPRTYTNIVGSISLAYLRGEATPRSYELQKEARKKCKNKMTK